jgi:hypothetical protein
MPTEIDCHLKKSALMKIVTAVLDLKKKIHDIIPHIMLRDLLTLKCAQKKEVTNFGYPRACRIRKYQI